MLGMNLFLYKNIKVSLLQNCPSFNDYVIVCLAVRVNTLRVSSYIKQIDSRLPFVCSVIYTEDVEMCLLVTKTRP